MRDYNSDYGNTAAPVVAGDYPYGQPNNSSVVGAFDGWPSDEKWMRDIVGFFSALVTDMGITPSGLEETAVTSDLLDALKVLAGITGGSSGNLPEIGSGKLVPSTTPNPNQDLRTTASPTFNDATIDSKLISTYLDYLNQAVKTTSSPTFATVNTGQGANELYDMDQNVLTTSSPTFVGLTLTGALLPDSSPTEGSVSLNDGATQVLSRGCYMFGMDIGLCVQIYHSSAWTTQFNADTNQAFVFAGSSNVRIYNDSGGGRIFRYLKF